VTPGTPIPVIDVFAGPGGLSEGFASLGRPEGKPRFAIRLSIEKDPIAHQTLELRAYFRQFNDGAPTDYYDHLRGELTRNELLQKWPSHAEAARQEAWNAELGKIDPTILRERMVSSLSPASGERAGVRGSSAGVRRSSLADPWVLIGGPPCQAYSLVGRSRNKGIKNYSLAKDKKAKLYLEYLQLIADFWPAVFVMENVKGLLSSRMDGEPVFDMICADLIDPAEALDREDRTRRRAKAHTYSLHALTPESFRGAKGDHETLFDNVAFRSAKGRESPTTSPADFVIRSELFGIPQARHRIIVVGIRDDIDGSRLTHLIPREAPTVEQMISDLSALRSGLSKEDDSSAAWVEAVLEMCDPRRLRGMGVPAAIVRILEPLRDTPKKLAKLTRGGEFVPCKPCIQFERDWFVDPHLRGVCNHSTRAHIRSDLHRYLFAAAFAEAYGRSPQLADFPTALLPNHDNVSSSLSPASGERAGVRGSSAGVRGSSSSPFADRFRVQHRYRHATTITSHISKDGHYYIHYDPKQCRSLTFREAARLQTFPDNYFFEGPRSLPRRG
jgi:DNA (cytosine-5)-methyltransferase 1